MAAATAVTSYVTALGPIKVEFVTCTMANSADTYVSKLSSPSFVIATHNATSTANPVTVITGRSIAVTETNISASTVNLIIVGF